MTAQPVRLHPARALTHPLWLGALALLVLNDHLFKGSGLLPGALTGKLSDVAGLFLAPALFAALLFVRSRHGLALAHVAIAGVFAAIKLSPAAAAGFESVMALGPLPWAITVDPTDLLALPALVLSWRLLSPAMTRPARVARPLTGFAFGAGLVASLATSPPPDDGFFPSLQADLVFGSEDATSTLILRVRPLRDSVRVDCAAALRDPTRALSRELFDAAEAWRVDPGRVVQARGDGFQLAPVECFAVLVDGTLHEGSSLEGETGLPVPLALMFWMGDDFPPELITSTTDGAPSDRLLRVVRTPSGPRWAPHSAIFPAPPEIPETPFPGCEPAPESGFIDWQEPVPAGTREIIAVDSAPDGCHRFIFASSGAWYLCTGTTTLPFVAGDRVDISRSTVGQSFEDAEVLVLLGAGEAAAKRVTLARGGDLAPWGYGEWSAGDLRECRGSTGPCGSLVFPQELTIEGPERDTILNVMAGDQVTIVGDRRGTLVVHRAERIPIGDRACLPNDGRDGDLVFESVYFEPGLEE